MYKPFALSALLVCVVPDCTYNRAYTCKAQPSTSSTITWAHTQTAISFKHLNHTADTPPYDTS